VKFSKPDSWAFAYRYPVCTNQYSRNWNWTNDVVFGIKTVRNTSFWRMFFAIWQKKLCVYIQLHGELPKIAKLRIYSVTKLMRSLGCVSRGSQKHLTCETNLFSPHQFFFRTFVLRKLTCIESPKRINEREFSFLMREFSLKNGKILNLENYWSHKYFSAL